jgi:hypothetical protein
MSEKRIAVVLTCIFTWLEDRSCMLHGQGCGPDAILKIIQLIVDMGGVESKFVNDGGTILHSSGIWDAVSPE